MSDSEQIDNDSSAAEAETESPKKAGRKRATRRSSRGDQEQSLGQEDAAEVEKPAGRRRQTRRSKDNSDAEGSNVENDSNNDEQDGSKSTMETNEHSTDAAVDETTKESASSSGNVAKESDGNVPTSEKDEASNETDKTEASESQLNEDAGTESNKEEQASKETDENGKEVLKIEESESDKEEEEELVVLEDIEDDGEDPWEVEVEKYNQPPEQMVASDLADMHNRRKVVVYPLKLSELNDAVMLKVIDKTTEFQTFFIQKQADDQSESETWNGFVELIFRSTKTAAVVIDELKTIREGLNVRYLEAGEVPRKLLISATGSGDEDPAAKIASCILIASAITEDMSVDDLKAVFNDAADVVIPEKRFPGKQIAYIIYETVNDMNKAYEKFTETLPEVHEKKLRILKYDPSSSMPSGLLRMKRRYKLLLQSDKLRRALKDKNANHPRSLIGLMRSTIDQCKSLLEKDDVVRKELGLPTYSFAELRRHKRIREAVTEDTIWIPGRKNRLSIERSLDNDETDENKYKRYQNEKANDAIPSLMSVELTPQLIKVPNNSGRMGPASGPPPIGMRGGMLGSGPRGGGGYMRGGPPDMGRGGFRGGRGGGFHDGPPLPPPRHDFEYDSYHGGRREGFGRGFDGGFRGGRGGNFGRGGDDGFHGGRDGGFGRGGYGRDDGFRPPDRGGFRRDDSRGGYNKRPRSPPPGGFKGDDASHKMPRRDDESKWGSSGSRQDYGSGPRGGRGGRGGYRQDGGSWNQSGGGRQSDQSKPPFPPGGQAQPPYGQNAGGASSASASGAGSAGASGASYGQQPMAPVPASTGYGQSYGQQPPAQPQQQGQAGYGQPVPQAGYGQPGYDPNAANMAAYGQQAAAYGQAGYGQSAGYGAQGQDPNAAYAGYGQAASTTDYYQAYQASMVQYPGYQTGATGQQQPQQAAQSWGMMPGAQQYWSGEQQQQAQQATSWPTGAEGTAAAAAAAAAAATTTDPNAAYWAAAGWKPS